MTVGCHLEVVCAGPLEDGIRVEEIEKTVTKIKGELARLLVCHVEVQCGRAKADLGQRSQVQTSEGCRDESEVVLAKPGLQHCCYLGKHLPCRTVEVPQEIEWLVEGPAELEQPGAAGEGVVHCARISCALHTWTEQCNYLVAHMRLKT